MDAIGLSRSRIWCYFRLGNGRRRRLGCRGRFGNVGSRSLIGAGEGGRRRRSGWGGMDGWWRSGLTGRRGDLGRRWCGYGLGSSSLGFSSLADVVTLNGLFLQEAEDIIEDKVAVGLLSEEKGLHELTPSLPTI
jgi:hypothetical protein